MLHITWNFHNFVNGGALLPITDEATKGLGRPFRLRAEVLAPVLSLDPEVWHSTWYKPALFKL